MSHPDVIMGQMKVCASCGEERPRESFTKDKHRRDGLNTRCRECTRTRDRKRYQQDPEERRRLRRDYYYRNREQEIAKARAWNVQNADRVSRGMADNRESVRESQRRWSQRNRDKVRAKRARRVAMQHDATIVEFTTEELHQRLSMFGHRCWMCGGEGTSIDHVKPLAAGGTHTLANLRSACGPCNTRKKDQWPFPIRQAA